MARIFQPISLSELTTTGVMFSVDPGHVKNDEQDSSPEEEEVDLEDLVGRKMKIANPECIGIFDEDDYQEGQPFERIAKKMTNLTMDGKIKKRILREGEGEKPHEHAHVQIHYSAYLEFVDDPFDSTYIRNKPLRFNLDEGRVIAGLDFGVQSMRLNEKSQFMIHPDYAYGKSGALNKIPPAATVLFEVELVDIVNSGAATTFEMLPKEQQVVFDETYKYCVALCERGKKSFSQNNLTKAVKDYNTAVCALNRAEVYSNDERQKQRELALKLHSNLLICYTRLGEPKKGCASASKIYEVTQNGELLNISAKVYFNHAKCLRFSSEYNLAKTILDKAHKLEPRNPEIANEFFNLESDKMDHMKKRMVFAKALVGDTR